MRGWPATIAISALSLLGLWPTNALAEAQPAAQVLWTQNHFDAAHDGYNRFETILSPTSVGGLQAKWTGRAPLQQVMNPVVTETTVYAAGGAEGSGAPTALVAFDRTTGVQLWHAKQPLANSVSGIATLGGRVFVTTVDDHMLRAYDGASGAFLWGFTGNGGLGSPTVANGGIYVHSNFHDLYAINPTTGRASWTVAFDGQGQAGGPAVAGGRVFTADGDGRAVEAFDARSGSALWLTPVDGSDYGSPTAVDGLVLVGTNVGTVYALDQTTGDVVWQATTGAGLESTPAIANGIVYVGDDLGDLTALDESDGTELWTAHTDRGFGLSSPIVANGVVYAATQGSYAYNALTGELLWHRPTTGIVNADPAVVDGVLYIPDFAGKLRAYALPVSGA